MRSSRSSYFIFLLGIVLGLSIAFSINAINKYRTVRQHYKELAATSQKKVDMLDFSNQIFNSFADYQSAVIAYTANPSAATKKALQTASGHLNDLLNNSNKIDLYTKKWVNLFQAWQYQFEQTVLASPKKIGLSSFDRLNTHRDSIVNSLKLQLQQNIDTQANQNTLSNDHANPTLVNQINTLLNKPSSAALITQYAHQLKENYINGKPSLCAGVSLDANDPNRVIQYVTFEQYKSRYCGFLVSAQHPTDYVQHLQKRTSTPETIAAYQVANARIAMEAKAANAKYGNLTNYAYYTRYVIPQLPAAIKALKYGAQSTHSFAACNPNYFAVAAFREPKIDAQNLAFVSQGNKLCQNYFKRTNLKGNSITEYLVFFVSKKIIM